MEEENVSSDKSSDYIGDTPQLKAQSRNKHSLNRNVASKTTILYIKVVKKNLRINGYILNCFCYF